MPKQHLAVPLLEGVHSPLEALTLRRPTMIGGIECDVLLPSPDPGPDPRPLQVRNLKPPCDAQQDGEPHWPTRFKWGHHYPFLPLIHDTKYATIGAVGVIPSEPVRWEDALADFDHAVAQWKHLLRDWLSVIAEGPTDSLKHPARSATGWSFELPRSETGMFNFGNIQLPRRVSRWKWEHVLAHTYAGDQPPLARVLLTTAKRAAATGNPRLAVIDAATAAEVALISGLTDRLSAEASPQVAQVLIDRTRMLGPRLDLARDLGMALPDRIRPDLLESRNAVVHRGTTVTDADAQAAITAAAELVDEYESLATHCQEPSGPSE
jgi:hypothetical protein